MERKHLRSRCVASILAIGLVAPAASAQSKLGNRGQLAVTADGLFEFSTQTVEWDNPGPPYRGGTDSDTSTRYGFMYSGRQNDTVTIFGPKVGVHYFIINGLSVGGTVGYESRGGETAAANANPPYPQITQGKPSMLTFLLEPKVGYALMFSPVIGFWFRGGIGYSDTEYGNGLSAHYFYVFAEAPLVISPVQNVAFTIGPEVAVSFSGARKQQYQNVIASIDSRFFGLSGSVGMLAYFDL